MINSKSTASPRCTFPLLLGDNAPDNVPSGIGGGHGANGGGGEMQTIPVAAMYRYLWVMEAMVTS
jgi:hypothetical protein